MPSLRPRSTRDSLSADQLTLPAGWPELPPTIAASLHALAVAIANELNSLPPMSMSVPTPDGPLLLTTTQVAERLNISRSSVWQLVASGTIDSIRIGRARRIPREAVERYIASQLREVTNERWY